MNKLQISARMEIREGMIEELKKTRNKVIHAGEKSVDNVKGDLP